MRRSHFMLFLVFALFLSLFKILQRRPLRSLPPARRQPQHAVRGRTSGDLIPCSTVESPAVSRFPNAAPLLEKERNSRSYALISDPSDPACVDWSCTRARLT